MDEDRKEEATEEYFYRDVTSFSTSSETVGKVAVDKVSCNGEVTWNRFNIETSCFIIGVPSDRFYCAMKPSDYTEKAIQSMKAKLREKKGV